MRCPVDSRSGSEVAEMQSWWQVVQGWAEKLGWGRMSGGWGAGVGNTCLYREQGEKHSLRTNTQRGSEIKRWWCLQRTRPEHLKERLTEYIGYYKTAPRVGTLLSAEEE